MKRIYLYFKEKTEKGEYTSRLMRIFLFWGLGIFSTIWFLVRVILHAGGGAVDVGIRHVPALVYGGMGEPAQAE